MPEDAEVVDQNEVDISKKIEKDEMVSFLTSTGKIREDFAGSLYDQGLNSWKVLIEGTEDYFTGLNRVGPARAKVLLDLALVKKDELETPRPGLKEALETIPRMNQKILSALLESGYVSFESFKETTPEDLKEIKGIGPKMSEAILEAVQNHLDTYGCEEAEEATAEMVDEEKEEGAKDERSMIQRIVDAIGGFFGGKKQEKEEEAEPSEKEEILEEKEEEPEDVEEPEEEGSDEKAEEEPDEEPAEEPPEEPAVEVAAEEPEEPSKESQEEDKEGTPEEEPEEKKGFMDKLKAMLFGGGKKEEEKKEEPAEEKAEEEPAEEEKEDTADEPAEEETPAEEAPVEETAKIEEPSIEEFEDIPGVSKKMADLLRKAGYMDINELREAVPEDLTMIDGIGPKTAEKICKAISR